MIFNTRHIALAAIASTLVSALPLDGNIPRNIIARAKSYSVINVDGGASTEAPADATTIVEQTTKTVEVTSSGPTTTAEVTTTVVESVPAATSTSTSDTSSSTTTRTTTRATSVSPVTSTTTPKPVFITVTITHDDGPTEYYDSGIWHTSYRIKSFEAVATPLVLSTPSAIAPSSTGVPAL